MFDTVTLIAFDVDINPNKLDQSEQFTYITDTGDYRTKIKYRKGRITYVYKLQQQILEIELSIPKLIYGTNVQSLSTNDIDTFWVKLQEELIEHLGVDIQKGQWKVKRLDVTYNFHVDNVGNYIIGLSKLNMSKRDKITYNENETVIFKNKSSSICFYDKEKECIKRKEDSEVVSMAQGVLRLEIRPASYHMREYSSSRKATDLLSYEYFSFIIERFRINDLLDSIENQNIDSDKVSLQKALNDMKVTDIEKVLGFSILINQIGEKVLLESGHYKDGTFRNRKEQIHQYSMITAKDHSIQSRLSVPIQ